jgi:hypothetical protein
LVKIIIPSSVEVVGEKCFSDCTSLSSVKFKSKSRLRQVGRDAFLNLPILPTIPTKKCNVW